MPEMPAASLKTVPVEDAVGSVLCHDMTQIVRGSFKGPRFRKGHIVAREDIPALKAMGKERLFVWEKPAGFLHEDEAAERLARLCAGEHIAWKGPSEGKIECFAEADGLFQYSRAALDAVNAVDGIVIAARRNNAAVKAGEKLAAAKAVPLVIAESALREAEAAAGARAFMAVKPYRLRRAALVVTGSEIASGITADTFSPALREKLAAYGVSVAGVRTPGDGADAVARAVLEAKEAGAELIICTGGMSVDPDDTTPEGIRRSGARVELYGAPVFPGAMFLLAYFPDGTPAAGLPACAMYNAATVFDAVLPRLLAGERVTKGDIRALASGGLCLSCPECRYPACPFCAG